MTADVTTLDNGVRVVTASVPTVDTVSVGVWAGVGARFEDVKVNGVAHLVEHMMFKGTPTRSALDISREIEDVGGQMNAYTSREVTAYYMNVMKEDTPLALDVLADITQHPTFVAEELERERGVILQEIGMYNDTPDEIIFDHFQSTAWKDQKIGAPILGTPDIIATLPQEELFNWVRTHYTAPNIIISAAGNLEHRAIVDQVERLFRDLPDGEKATFEPANYTGGDFREEKELEQAHLMLGFESLSRHDEDYYAAGALSTLLGGGMSSRLFQEVREKRGLVYSIFCFNQSFDDSGQMAVYAGTDPQRLDELTAVVCDELAHVADTLKEDEIKRAKAQLRSRLLMAQERMFSRAQHMATSLIHYGEPVPLDDIIAKIDAVDANALARVARRVFTSRPTLTALGALDRLESHDQVSGRLNGAIAA